MAIRNASSGDLPAREQLGVHGVGLLERNVAKVSLSDLGKDWKQTDTLRTRRLSLVVLQYAS